MKQVVFHPLAEKELIDAAVYYEEQEHGLGGKYLSEVEYAINFISQYPEAGFTARGFLRRLTLPKFPITCYIVFWGIPKFGSWQWHTTNVDRSIGLIESS